MRRTALRALLLATLIAAVVGALASDLPERFDLEELRQRLRGSGAAGAALFVAALAVLQPLGVSVYVFLLSASAVWPAPVAVGLSWLGIMGAGLLSFAFSRFVAFDWVHARMGETLRRWDRRLATTGFRTVLVTRLLFFTTVPVQLMYGVSSVRFRDFVAGSAIGIVPATAVTVVVGAQVIDWFAATPTSRWAPMALAIAVTVVAAGSLLYLLRRRKRRGASRRLGSDGP